MRGILLNVVRTIIVISMTLTIGRTLDKLGKSDPVSLYACPILLFKLNIFDN